MMSHLAKFFLIVFTLIGVALTAGPALAATPDGQTAPSIIDRAIDDGRFSTLVSALQEASLFDTLRGEGPFTVFAPTDDAFNAVPSETLNTLLADPAALRDVLLYHVVPGRLLAAEVANLASIETAMGQPLTVSVEGNVIKINEAQIIMTDIEATNGVIHVIDAVLLPPTPIEEEPPAEEPAAPTPNDDQTQDIIGIAIANGRFTKLVEAIQAADLTETLKRPGPYTLFAPTDEAFAALPEGALDELLADAPALRNVLLYHVLRGSVPAAEVAKLSAADTVLGPPVSILVEGNTTKINEATVIATNIQASNGLIHVIDAVLLPPEDQRPTPDPDYDRPPVYHNPHPYTTPYDNYDNYNNYNNYNDDNNYNHYNCCNNYGHNCCGYNNYGSNYGQDYPGYGSPYGYFGANGYRYSYYSYYPYRPRW